MSSVNRIKTLLQPSQRFARSVHLERDFRDSTALSQYVVTDRVGQLFRRFGSAFAIGSTERAWCITGDYGTGKSCFALALARICDPKSLGLPKQSIDVSKSLPKANAIPVLVTGACEPISAAIIRAIEESLNYSSFKKIPT